jgi:hypothetical protein
MREVHIRQPIWNGDRTEVLVGIARKRIMDGQNIARRDIRVFIDYQEKVMDTTVEKGYRYKLVYPLPFQISCENVSKFLSKPLNDYMHTVVHYVPLSAMREVQPSKSGKPRKRTMPQSEFAKIRAYGKAIAEEERLKNA